MQMKNSVFVLPEHLLYFLITHAQSLTNNLQIQTEMPWMPCKHRYGDIVFESLLLHLQPTIESLTGKKLIPTYFFFRSYTKGSELKAHRDRPSCEYSTTVYLGSSDTNTPWSIYMDNVPVDLKIGQGVVYKGCEQEHYRDPCPHDFSNHVFLHYVDANGKNKNYAYDEREFLYQESVQG
jgi:hypothetical protein